MADSEKSDRFLLSFLSSGIGRRKSQVESKFSHAKGTNSSRRCAIIKFLPTKRVQWVSGALWEPFCRFSQIDKQKVHPWMWQLTMDCGFILCANSCKRQFRCDRRVHDTEYMMLHQEGDCVCMCVCVCLECATVCVCWCQHYSLGCVRISDDSTD